MVHMAAFGTVPILALIFVSAIITATILTYCIRNLARTRHWAISEVQRHHIHRRPIPRCGGIAIYLTFLIFFVIVALTGTIATWRDSLPLLATSTIMFLVGLADDLRGLQPKIKLAFEIAVGTLLFFSGTRLLQVVWEPWGWPLGQALSLAATVFWVVMITNALNLIDGLDGLAAGSALFSIVSLFGLALVGHDHDVVAATLILGGAVLGFLRYNFNPASIFLGDCGSLFLGCMLSGLSLQANQAAMPTMVAVAIPVVAFGLPVVETAVSVLRRFLSGKPLFRADQDHIHHRLLNMGLSHRQAVIALYGICACCTLLCLMLLYPGRALVALVLLVIGTIFCLGVQRLGYAEFSEISRIAQRTLEQKRVIANNVACRKAAKALRRAKSYAEITTILDDFLRDGEFDGYKLVVRSSDGAVLIEEKDEQFSAGNWRLRTNGRDAIVSKPSWFLTLDLAVGNRCIGQLIIRRNYRYKSFLIDVNIITLELQPALSAACARLATAPARELAQFAPSSQVYESAPLSS
jgi:UDP-GlcNAc:undecaprenyl-phosphate GlcNAc-1-phosphate transferase